MIKKQIMPTIKLTNQQFIDEIFDYTTEKEWKYKDNVPAIIDFYADWCGPCKMVAPVLEELSEMYDGKVKIYKLDTEKEQQLAGVFGIRSIPSLLFIPVEGQPMMQVGALPKSSFIDVIENQLLKENTSEN
ncbi:MAG: thioredoxin [Deltaproteobacteria bacterium]